MVHATLRIEGTHGFEKDLRRQVLSLLLVPHITVDIAIDQVEMLLREEFTVLCFCPCDRLHAQFPIRQAHLTGCNQTVRPAPIKPMPKMTPEMTKRMSKPLTTYPRIPTIVEVINKANAHRGSVFAAQERMARMLIPTPKRNAITG